ncbi:AMP-binding protein [Pseudomonas sp. NPDC089752]|uniref:AMP-binding protein n=1 Tax=Pseudomonas sp. NPDC089752 TaxID=3364472 RepID=UPI0038056309
MVERSNMERLLSLTPDWPAQAIAKYQTSGCWRGENLFQMVADAARETPRSVALREGDRILNYTNLHQKALSLGLGLRAQGLNFGDCLVVQLPNCIELVVTLFGCISQGIVPLFALPAHRHVELHAYCERIGARTLLLHDDDNGLGLQLMQQGLIDRVITVARSSRQHETAFATLLATVAEAHDARPSGARDLALFQLSGGTTGIPKIIPRRHDDYLYSVRRSVEICELSSETRYLSLIPLAHNFAMSSPGFLGVLLARGQVILSQELGSARVLSLIDQQYVNMVTMVPALLARWVDWGMPDRLQGRNVLVQVGGAKLHRELAHKAIASGSIRLQQVFGMAEGLVCYTAPNDPTEVVASTQGTPMSELDEVELRGQTDTAGELCARGPYMIPGYFNDPHADRQAFDLRGFYRSGDLVRRAHDGYLEVIGRSVETLNRNGEKIDPHEVENVMMKHPAVVDAVLVGLTATDGTLRLVLFAIATQPLTLVQAREFLMTSLANFKLPDEVRLIDSLPLTAVGKVDRNEIRRLLRLSLMQKERC